MELTHGQLLDRIIADAERRLERESADRQTILEDTLARLKGLQDRADRGECQNCGCASC